MDKSLKRSVENDADESPRVAKRLCFEHDSDEDSDASFDDDEPESSVNKRTKALILATLTPSDNVLTEKQVMMIKKGRFPTSLTAPQGPGQGFFWPEMALKDTFWRGFLRQQLRLRAVYDCPNFKYDNDFLPQLGDRIAISLDGHLQDVVEFTEDGVRFLTVALDEDGKLKDPPNYVLEKGLSGFRSSIVYEGLRPRACLFNLYKLHRCDCDKQERKMPNDQCSSHFCHYF